MKIVKRLERTNWSFDVEDVPDVQEQRGDWSRPARIVTIRPGRVEVVSYDGLVGWVSVHGPRVRKDTSLGAQDSVGFQYKDHQEGKVPDWVEQIVASVPQPWGKRTSFE